MKCRCFKSAFGLSGATGVLRAATCAFGQATPAPPRALTSTPAAVSEKAISVISRLTTKPATRRARALAVDPSAFDGDRVSLSLLPDVALAAIQGLNEKVEVRSQNTEASICKLKAENADLKARLEKLEQLLNDKHNGGAK